MTSNDLLALLRARHAKDVFVPQCKDGPTWNTEHLRLDAWAMKRSWSKPCTYGYEIKVSRQDFLQDTKYPCYKAYCNELYIVAPPGLIDKAEVAEHVGLIEATKGGGRLRVRRRAAYRDVVYPEDFWRYLVMCRATFGATPRDGLEFWREWLEHEGDCRDVGHKVGRRLRQQIEGGLLAAEWENGRLRERLEDMEVFRAELVKAGFDPDDLQYRRRRQMECMREGLPARMLEECVEKLQTVLQAMAQGDC